MKKLLFIYNPQAGKGQVRPQLAAILDAFSKAGYLTSAWPTQGPATPLGWPPPSAAGTTGWYAAAATEPSTRWSPA